MSPYAKVTFRGSIIVWAIIFLVMCTGCSMLAGLAMDAATNATAKGDPLVGVETEIVAGDKQGVKTGPDTKIDDTEIHGDLSTSTIGKQTEVTGSNGVVNLNEGVSPWLALMGILLGVGLGLFLPQYKLNRK